MANTKQAKKRAVQNLRQRERNRSVRTGVRHAVRDLRQGAAAGTGTSPEALADVVSGLDRAVRKGVLHRNTAARLKSRVTRTAAKGQRAPDAP
ncbi:MAG: 30S ribosomal protein S20 [Acidithiobacillales bacterium]